MGVQVPLAKTVFVCDDVVHDVAKNKTSLLNLFDAIRVGDLSEFPYSLGKLCVYAECSDGIGTFEFSLEIEQMGTNETIHRTTAQQFEFSDPIQLVKLYFRLHHCVFPEPGSYVVQLFCDTMMLGDRVIRVLA